MTALYQSFATKCWPEIRGAMPPAPSPHSTAKNHQKQSQNSLGGGRTCPQKALLGHFNKILDLPKRVHKTSFMCTYNTKYKKLLLPQILTLDSTYVACTALSPISVNSPTTYILSVSFWNILYVFHETPSSQLNLWQNTDTIMCTGTLLSKNRMKI